MRLLMFGAATILAACATAGKINEVQVGMTRDQVVAAIGRPVSVSAQGNLEYLNYRLSETSDDAFYGIERPYYVRLINGRVESFGRVGDFNSTQVPTQRLITEQSSETKIKTENVADLDSKLRKLKALKDDGLISEDEFQAQRKKLLEGTQ
jgi:outer membrane protein assembly factor BamE (lipoprotein component of BamABCDE complex)